MNFCHSLWPLTIVSNDNVSASLDVGFTVKESASLTDRPVIELFKNNKDNSTKNFFTIANDTSDQTVISYNEKPTWNNSLIVAVNGYTSESASEYTRLCITATFVGTKQFAVELPYNDLDNNLELLWSDFKNNGQVTKNADGSYTFDILLSDYSKILSEGISSIMIFLDMGVSVSGARSMTIHDISFRKDGEPAR